MGRITYKADYATPNNPPVGSRTTYFDARDGKFKFVDGFGNVHTVLSDFVRFGPLGQIVDAGNNKIMLDDLYNNRTDNNVTKIPYPGDGVFFTANQVTGALVVTLPQSWTNTHLQFSVEVAQASDAASFQIQVAGINSSLSSSWGTASALYLGHASNPFAPEGYRVRFGHDGTACCIVIGEDSTTWFGICALIKGLQASDANFSQDKWSNNWNVAIVPSLSGYTFTKDFSATDVLPISASAGPASGPIPVDTSPSGLPLNPVDYTVNKVYFESYSESDLGITTNDLYGVLETRTYLLGAASQIFTGPSGVYTRTGVNTSWNAWVGPLA